MKSLVNKFRNAIRGLLHYLGDPSINIQLGLALIAIIFGFVFQLSAVEWCIIIFCCGLVITCEMINSCIERILDFVQPNYNKKIGIIKDMAAGFVMTSAIVAFIVACIIFGNKIF